MLKKILTALATLLLAPIIFPTGVVLCWFYFYVVAVNGTVGYFTGIGFFKWIPYALASLLLVKGLLLLKGSSKLISVGIEDRGLRNNLLALVLIWLTYIVSASIINSISILQFVVGAKQYILMWGVFVLFAVTNMQALYIEKIWKIFLVILVVQVPVVLVQYVYFVGFRLQSGSGLKNDAAWDSIVGTFGGDPLSGGNSAGLAFFISVMVIFTLGLMKKKLIEMKYAILVLLSALSVLLFAEVKIVFLMIPLGLLWLFRKDILHRPLKVFFGMLVLAAVMLVISSSYQSLYYSHGKELSSAEQFDQTFKTLTDTDLIFDETGEMGRLASWFFWWHENTTEYGMINFLIGHGMLASRSVSLFLSDNIAADYGLHIDANGLAILLWDFGFVGVLLYLSILIYGALISFRLSNNRLIPEFHRVALETGGICLLLLVLAIAHHPSPIVTAISQSVMFLLLGQCMYWQRNALIQHQIKGT